MTTHTDRKKTRRTFREIRVAAKQRLNRLAEEGNTSDLLEYSLCLLEVTSEYMVRAIFPSLMDREEIP